MNINEQKKQYRVRIAALKLYDLFKVEAIFYSDNSILDLEASLPSTSLKFGVIVGGYDFVKSNDYKKSVISRLKALEMKDPNNLMPICIIGVNENTQECCCGIVASVRWKRMRIDPQPPMIKLNDKNVSSIVNSLLASDYIIRSLTDDKLGVLKTYYIASKDSRRVPYSGQIAYVRNFSYMYKMQSPKEVTQEEKLERYFKGIPQEEYPHDSLDEIIMGALKDNFDKVELNNSLYLFSTDLADIKTEYGHKIEKCIRLSVEPNLDFEALVKLGELIECPCINLTLYLNPGALVKDSINDEITVKVKNDDWIHVFKKVSLLKNTLRDLSEDMKA